MLDTLLRASLEGALLAGGVWLLCRALPRLSPAVRAGLWWCVAAKFVIALVWTTPIAVPVLPATANDAPSREMASAMERPAASSTAMPTRSTSLATSQPRVGGTPDSDGRRDIPWTAIVVTLWGIGIATSALRTAAQWRETQGLLGRALPADAQVIATVRDLSRLLGVRRTPDVRCSTEIASPVITGLRAPVIIVPVPQFAGLSPEQQRMALCHELAHMQRGDLWLGCVPALVERCFFFHPLARLAAREYAFWREAACDEAVLATLGASPQSYGRLLLALGVSRQPAAFAAAGAAWSFPDLKRRIVMLGHRSSPSSRLLGTSAVALAVLALAPVKAVARTADAATAATPWPTMDVAAVATEQEAAIARAVPAQPARAVRAARVARTAATEVTAAVSPAAAARPAVALAATAAVAPAQDRRRRDELQFVYLRDDNNTTMSGSRGDVERARRLRRGREPLLWFRHDGDEYVVRDPEVLREMDRAWEEVQRIGEEMGRIGAQQGEIGAEQGRHGAKQGEIGAAQGLIGAKQGVIGARLGLLSAREALGVSAAERREMDRERESLDREMRALEREMEALSRKMRDVEPPSDDLGRRMNALGRQMDVVSRQMDGASRRAESDMRALMERSIRNGAAQRVR